MDWTYKLSKPVYSEWAKIHWGLYQKELQIVKQEQATVKWIFLLWQLTWPWTKHQNNHNNPPGSQKCASDKHIHAKAYNITVRQITAQIHTLSYHIQQHKIEKNFNWMKFSPRKYSPLLTRYHFPFTRTQEQFHKLKCWTHLILQVKWKGDHDL